MASTLELVLLYLVAAVLGVAICRSLKLPPILGYLAVGVLIGPNALALAKDTAGVKYLAEFGVVFLMFVIGLEFNLPKLRAMRTLVFGLGLSQVMLTILAVLAGNAMLIWLFSFGARAWELSFSGAVVLGSAAAMSSTAIVVKLMADRLELDSEHGKRVMGVLLFQDLAVVPLLVVIPALGSAGGDMAVTLGWALLKATVILTVLLTGGQQVMRWWLTLVARRKSEELFVLNLLLITLGLSWMTEHAGLSLPLGAFVAGMLVAETEFKHQVETDIRPFHDVLLGLFFITIGMKLDWRPVLDQWLLVLLLSMGPVLAKLALVALLARLFGAPPGTALRTGLYLAQAGEFGFVLADLGRRRRPGRAAVGQPGAGQHGAVDAGHAVHHHVQQPHRGAPVVDGLDAAVGRPDHDRQEVDRKRSPCDHLRLWPQRAEPGAPARRRAHPVHGAGSRPRSRAPGRCSRPERGLRRRRAAAQPDGRRPGSRQCRGGVVPRHALGVEDPAGGAFARTAGAGGGAYRRRERHRPPARRPARPRSCPRRSRVR